MFGASLRAAGQLRVNGHLFMRSLSALGDASAVLCSGDGVGGCGVGGAGVGIGSGCLASSTPLTVSLVIPCFLVCFFTMV